MKNILLFALSLCGLMVLAQQSDSWVEDLPFQGTTFGQGSGRIVAVSKNPTNNFEMYIAFEKSGVWYSQNNGASFTPVFSDDMSLYVSAMGVDWNKGVVWVSTDKGVYNKRGTDGVWIRANLSNLKNVREFIFPSENEIGIAVMGDATSQKGYFYSQDGGVSWSQTFSSVGVVDVEMSPKDGKVIYMAAWDLSQTPYEITPYGRDTGLYKSKDAGKTWEEIGKRGSGFPRTNIGRMSIAAFDSNTLYVLLDNRNKLWRDKSEEIGFDNVSAQEFLSLEDDKIDEFIYKRGLHHLYSAQNLKEMVRSKATTPDGLKKTIDLPFEVIGAEVYKSVDGGEKWTKTHNSVLENVFYNKGYEVCALEINPNNQNELYIYAVPLLKSVDGGKSWRLLKDNPLDVKVDNFGFEGKQLVSITNQGTYQSLDFGKNWIRQQAPETVEIKNLSITGDGQIYASVENEGIFKLTGDNWVKISQQVGNLAVDDSGKFYVGKGFGTVYSSKLSKESTPPYYRDKNTKFGENTPVFISPQNNSIIYTGGNALYQSLNEGRTWSALSGELTNGNKGGNVSYGNITAISESPFQFGLLYVGTDDGMVQVSGNGGVSWQMVYSSFPQLNSVSCIVASKHQMDRVYVVVKSYMSQPLVFRSDDRGKTWNNLRSNLPEENVLTIAEDPQNEQVLYLGTDSGIYVSFDMGEKWHKFKNGLPKISVNQIVIDDKTKMLYAGTQNRGVFKGNISALKELKAAVQDQIFYPLAEEFSMAHSTKWGNASRAWETPEKPNMYFVAFSSVDGNKITIRISKEGVVLKSFEYTTKKGFNYIPYDLCVDDKGRVEYEKKKLKVFYKKATDGNYYIVKGTYQLNFVGELVDEERTLRIY